MNKIISFLIVIFSCNTAFSENYLDREEVREFVNQMVEKYKLPRKSLESAFTSIKKSDDVIAKITHPAEALPWSKYQKLFLSEKRVNGGKKFLQDNAEVLSRAEKDFGVPAEIITAIIGVESLYGEYKGKYPVLEALSTLAFDYPPRANFFKQELEQYLLLTHEQKLNPLELKGSYAGAMGYPQFISSSYRRFAVDFDKSGSVDLLHNMTQAIGSVANYFKVHGWKPGEPIITKARITGEEYKKISIAKPSNPVPTLSLKNLNEHSISPEQNLSSESLKFALLEFDNDGKIEHWLGANNFYVITRYNHSSNYALAVYMLAQAVK